MRTMESALRAVRKQLQGEEYSYAPGSGGPNGIIPGEWAEIDGKEICVGRGDGVAHTVLRLDEVKGWLAKRKEKR